VGPLLLATVVQATSFSSSSFNTRQKLSAADKMSGRSVITGSMNPALVPLSKSMSKLLRHTAGQQGVAMEKDGSVAVIDILKLKNFSRYSKDDILNVVQTNDKQRFELMGAEPHLRIRARQGHSKQVGSMLDDAKLLTPLTEAPPVCVHGTYVEAWEIIKTQGLKRMNRQHIHFTDLKEKEGQDKVSGFRANAQVLIYLDAALAMADGIVFFVSSNGVILTEGIDGCVPPKYFKRVTTRDGRDLLAATFERGVSGPGPNDGGSSGSPSSVSPAFHAKLLLESSASTTEANLEPSASATASKPNAELSGSSVQSDDSLPKRRRRKGGSGVLQHAWTEGKQ